MVVFSCGSSKDKFGDKQDNVGLAQQLIDLGNSGRISSNHYSDVVLDSKGNAYIASFFTKADDQDYIKIIQVQPSGEIGWVIGEQTIGRATAITINNEDEIWVTGYFSNTFTCGTKVLKSTASENMFIVKLNPSGACSWSFVSGYGSKAFDIHVNKNNELLIAGVLAEKERLGKIEVVKNPKEAQFLAKFEGEGSCAWIKQFNGNVRRIKSDPSGRFYVCGSYANELFDGVSTNKTTSNYDHDGFLFQVTDTINWIWNFGNPGVIKYGYRTYDVAADMDIDESGNIWVITTQENQDDVDSASSTIVGLVYSFNSTGVLQHTFETATNLQKGAVSTISMQRDSMKVTGTKLSSNEEQGQSLSFIRTYSYDGSLLGEQIVSFTGHGMFRCAYSNNSGTVFTGHYTIAMSIDSLKIENKGGHDLFMYRQ